jgi:hypothetical protein
MRKKDSELKRRNVFKKSKNKEIESKRNLEKSKRDRGKK